jgi:uncharacterized protein (DUF58 family)
VRRASLAVGLGLALYLTAAGFGAAPLYVPAVALLLLAIGAVAWVSFAARHVRVMRSVTVTAIEEDHPLPLTLQVLRSRLPLPGAELRAWPGGPALALPESGDGSLALRTTIRFPRRGRRRLDSASLLVRDPLGLCRRSILSAVDEVLVLPRIEPLRLGDVGGAADAWVRTGRTAMDAASTEIDSLRPYRAGTPASRIHWPTVARTMSLMERRLVADHDQRPLVVVDPRHPPSADALDQALRAAASLCVHLARRGGCALLLPGDRRPTTLDPELHGWPMQHARLALLEPHAGAPPVAGLERAEAVLWVTAASGPPAGLAGVRARLLYLVSPDPLPRRPVEFTVAGCSGQSLDRGRTKASTA